MVDPDATKRKAKTNHRKKRNKPRTNQNQAPNSVNPNSMGSVTTGNAVSPSNVNAGSATPVAGPTANGMFALPLVKLVENGSGTTSHVFDNVVRDFRALRQHQLHQTQQQQQQHTPQHGPTVAHTQIAQQSVQSEQAMMQARMRRQYHSTPKLFSEHYTQRYPQTTSQGTQQTMVGEVLPGDLKSKTDADNNNNNNNGKNNGGTPNPYARLYYENPNHFPRALTWHGKDQHHSHTQRATSAHQTQLIQQGQVTTSIHHTPQAQQGQALPVLMEGSPAGAGQSRMARMSQMPQMQQHGSHALSPINASPPTAPAGLSLATAAAAVAGQMRGTPVGRKGNDNFGSILSDLEALDIGDLTMDSPLGSIGDLAITPELPHSLPETPPADMVDGGDLEDDMDGMEFDWNESMNLSRSDAMRGSTVKQEIVGSLLQHRQQQGHLMHSLSSHTQPRDTGVSSVHGDGRPLSHAQSLHSPLNNGPRGAAPPQQRQARPEWRY